MTKRILGLAISAVLVLGVFGFALAAASPDDSSSGLEADALALIAEPNPPASPPAPPATGPKREQLRACVKPKVDAGTARKTAVKECADQLGIKPGRPGKLGRLGRAARAELLVPKQGAEGQWETVVVDRGKVTAASADSISVQRPDGPTVTVKVVAGTKVRGVASVAELAPGREVAVVSAGGEARSVVARP